MQLTRSLFGKFAAVAALALAAVGSAHARDVYWSVGIDAAPGVSVGVGNHRPVIVQPAPVYVPQVVYTQPQVIYTQPQVIYPAGYISGPVVVHRGPVYHSGYYGHRHGHHFRDHGRGHGDWKHNDRYERKHYRHRDRD